MADATLGALSVILGGDASALDSMLAGAQNSVSSFARNVTSIAAGIGLEKAVEGALSSIAATIKGGLADADQLAKMSESTGIAVDELSKLKYAGDLSGVSLDSLGKSLNTLASDMVAAANGSVTPATQAFTAMGLSVKNVDGTMKTSIQMWADIADKFSGYKDGVNKSALAQQIFVANGEALIPVLNKGRAGLSDMGDEAQKFGLVMSGETQFAVQSLNDNLKKMDAIKQGLVATIVGKLAPAFEQISVVMLDAKENGSLMAAVADGLATALKGVISVGLQTVVIFQQLSAELSAFWGAVKSGNWLALGDTIKSAFAASDLAGEKFKETLGSVKNAVAEIWSDPSLAWDQQTFKVKEMQAEVAKLGLSWTQIAAPIAAAADTTGNALQTFLDRTAKATAATLAEAQTVGLSTSAHAQLKVQLEAQAISVAKNIPITEAYAEAIKKAGDDSAAAAQKLQAANLKQDILTPWEKRNQLLSQYGSLLATTQITQADFDKASQKIQFPNFTSAMNSALDFKASIDTLGTSLVNGLASSLAQVVTGAKSAADAFGAFALQFATQIIEMIAKAVIFKAIMTAIGFSGGGPAGQMTVGDQTFPAFKAAGGPIVGPGTGTSDSIPAMLSNGEFVVNAEQTKAFAPLLMAINSGRMNGLQSFAGGGMVSSRLPNAAMTSVPQVQPSSPAARVIQVSGINKSDFFDRDTVIGLMKSIGVQLGRGYKLQVN